jgi:hypothetical protein
MESLQAFPQAKWRELVPETVMHKFAESRGGSFPAPQYSNGLTMALAAQGPEQHTAGSSKALKGTGVALIGDAAHCFPPDLGGCGGVRAPGSGCWVEHGDGYCAVVANKGPALGDGTGIVGAPCV